jgi:hypothetical protein
VLERSLLALPVQAFTNRPEKLGDEEPAAPDECRSPKKHTTSCAHLAAPRWIVGCSDFTILQMWSDINTVV